MKAILRLLLLFLLPIAAFGQSVALTGTVTDTPDAQTWNNGTITFTFFGPQSRSYIWTGGTIPTPITAALSVTGTYSVSIPDNSQMTPGDSSWTVRICPAVLPAQTGCSIFSRVITSATPVVNFTPDSPRFNVPLTPQSVTPISAYADAEIAGGWVGFQYYNLTTAANRVCQVVTGVTCTTWAAVGSGSGTTTGAANPTGACANGALYVNTTTAALWLCSGLVWVPDTFSGQNTVDSARYGVTQAGNESCFATFTNASTAVTTPATSPPFPTATPVPTTWRAFGTNTCVDNTSYLEVAPVGTITFTGAHTATLGVAANANAAGTATQHLIWAPMEDVQLTNAENAAWNANTVGGDCFTLLMGAGIIGVRTGHFNTINCNTQTTGPSSTGAHVFGVGRVATRLMVFPDMDYTTCPAMQGGGSNTCFGAKLGLTKERFGISGGHHPGTNPAAVTCLMNDSTDDFTINVGLFALGPSLANLIAYCQSGVGATPQLLIVDGAGTNGAVLAGTGFSCTQCFFGNNTTSNISDNGNTIIGECWACGYGPTSATSGQIRMSGATTTWEDYNPVILAAASSNYYLCNSGATCTIHGLRFPLGIGANSNVFAVSSGAGRFIVDHSNVASSGTGLIWNLASTTAKAYDKGENTYTFAAGNYAALTGAATIFNLAKTSTYSNTPTQIVPTCTFTSGGGTTPSCSTQTGSTNEGGVIIATTGTGAPGNVGTITLTFAGTYVGGTSTAPNCVYTFDQSAAGQWNGRATIFASTQSTTVPVAAWDNNAVNLGTSTAFRIGYACLLR